MDENQQPAIAPSGQCEHGECQPDEVSYKAHIVCLLGQAEERILRLFDYAQNDISFDRRWLAIACTHIEQGFMAAERAIYKRSRITLPEDDVVGPSIGD